MSAVQPEPVPARTRPSLWKTLSVALATIGPAGILVSTAMGPGTVSSAITGGAHIGYPIVWIAFISGPLGAVLSYCSAKLVIAGHATPIRAIMNAIGKPLTWILTLGWLFAWYTVIVLEGKILTDVYNVVFPFLGFWEIFSLVLLTCLAVWYVFWRGFKAAVALCGGMCVVMALAFLVNAFIAGPPIVEILRGLVPSWPSGGEIAFAGIVGGACGGIGIFMAGYSFKERGWDKPKHRSLILTDITVFWVILFTILSVGIVVSGAATLQPAGVRVMGALDAAQALEPLAGPAAKWIFVLGMWATVFTTIGGMCAIGAYAWSDLLGWKPRLDDPRTKLITSAGIGLTVLGALVAGHAMPLIVWGMAMFVPVGFFAMIAVMYTMNSRRVMGEERASWLLNVLIFAVFAVNAIGFYNVLGSWFGF